MASQCPKCHNALEEDYICCADVEYTWQCKSCGKLTKGLVIPFGRCYVCGGELEVLEGYKGLENRDQIELARSICGFELDHYLFYSVLGRDSTSKEIQSLFAELAEAEMDHLKELESKYHVTIDKNFDMERIKSNILLGVEIDPADTDPFTLMEKGMQIEKNAQEFYEEKARMSDNLLEIDLFRQLAAEERDHYAILKTNREFMKRK